MCAPPAHPQGIYARCVKIHHDMIILFLSGETGMKAISREGRQ
jgi:hypothetical protein